MKQRIVQGRYTQSDWQFALDFLGNYVKAHVGLKTRA
jgi:hypothetical protein